MIKAVNSNSEMYLATIGGMALIAIGWVINYIIPNTLVFALLMSLIGLGMIIAGSRNQHCK